MKSSIIQPVRILLQIAASLSLQHSLDTCILQETQALSGKKYPNHNQYKKIQMISEEKMSRQTSLKSILSANSQQMDGAKGYSSKKTKITAQEKNNQIKSRSNKTKSETIEEISFQKYLPTSHQSRLGNIFSTYETECKKILKNPQAKLLIDKIQNIELIEVQFDFEELEKAIQKCGLLDQTEKLQFIEDLKYEENFANILFWAMKIIQDEISSDLIFLVCYIWEEYLINKAIFFQVKDLIQRVKNLGNLNMKKIALLAKNITHEKLDPKALESLLPPFSRLLFDLIEVMILVIEGYFQSNINCLHDDILLFTGMSTSSKSSQASEIQSKSSTDSLKSANKIKK